MRLPRGSKGHFQITLGESVKESVDLDGYTHSYAFATWAENSPESEHASHAMQIMS